MSKKLFCLRVDTEFDPQCTALDTTFWVKNQFICEMESNGKLEKNAHFEETTGGNLCPDLHVCACLQ